MKILWTEFAEWNLKEIYSYHIHVANSQIAIKIKHNILSATEQLKNHPLSGQLEEPLLKLNEKHRYLVCNNYKIIYKEVIEGILITDVFDTRLNPCKMNNDRIIR